MILKYGSFDDYWNGDGVYVSLLWKRGHFLIGVRKCLFVLRALKPPGKPGYARLYIGPFEFEVAHVHKD